MRSRPVLVGVVAAVVTLGLAAPGRGAGATTGAAVAVIRVPTDAATIQRAVDRARPGSVVLVTPGVYRESVTVSRAHHDVVIRGEDRARTVVDCGFSEDDRQLNGFKVLANGVAIENLTARDCKSNGFLWQGVRGYRGSYLTAVRNGDYGLYAFASTHGQWDHDYASGSPDAGFYIGQCYPCHAVITDVESTWNGLGYSGTNSGGDLVIVRSVFHDNRAGVVPNSGTEEANPPERHTTIVGNTVDDNNNAQTAAIDIAVTAQGNGVLLAGGDENLVERNLVVRQDLAGIAVVPLPERILTPGPRAQNFAARRNRVVDNTVRDSRYDLSLVSSIDSATDPGGNCFARNRFLTSLPADLQAVVPCTGPPSGPFRADLASFAAALLAAKPPSADYRTVPLPPVPPLPQLPDARHAPARPATRAPSVRIALATVRVPADSTVPSR